MDDRSSQTPERQAYDDVDSLDRFGQLPTAATALIQASYQTLHAKRSSSRRLSERLARPGHLENCGSRRRGLPTPAPNFAPYGDRWTRRDPRPRRDGDDGPRFGGARRHQQSWPAPVVIAWPGMRRNVIAWPIQAWLR